MSEVNQTAIATDAELKADRDALMSSLGNEVGEQAPVEDSVIPDAGEHAPADAPKEVVAEDPNALKKEPDQNEPKTGDEPKTQEGEKPKSRYEKSQERKAQTWDEINAEKAKLTAEKSEFEQNRIREEQRLKDEAAKVQAASKYTPEQYEEAAKKFEDQGQDDLAKVAREEAQKLREFKVQNEQHVELTKVQKAWTENLNKEVASNPELKDPNSLLFKTVDQVLQLRKQLATYPEGINDAVNYAKTYVQAQKAVALEKQVTELKAELAAANKALQPSSGQPASSHRGETKFDNLSLEDQRKQLLTALGS